MNMITPLNGVTLNQFFQGPIPEYRPIRIGNENVPLTGITASIRKFYKESLKTETGKLFIEDTCTDADPEVVAALKAVLLSGICKTKERSFACRDVFHRAYIRCGERNPYDVDLLLSSFVEEDDNPFVLRIQDALKEVLDAS